MATTMPACHICLVSHYKGAIATHMMTCTPSIESSWPDAFREVKSVKNQTSDIRHDGCAKRCCLVSPAKLLNHESSPVKAIPCLNPCWKKICNMGANIAKHKNRKKLIRQFYGINGVQSPRTHLVFSLVKPFLEWEVRPQHSTDEVYR